MRAEDIQQLACWLAQAGLAELALEGPGLTLRLALAGEETGARAAATLAVSPAGTADAPDGRVVAAPIAGILRLQHPHGAAPLVDLGDEVAAGAVIALLQVGLIFAPVIAPVGGVLARMLALPDSLQGFGAPLFEIVARAEPRP